MDEALLMTGDELVERIGARATYDLVLTLERRGKAIAHYSGRPGRRSQDKVLRKRNIEILRLRIVERHTHKDIGRAVGTSAARIPQVLHDYFGVDRLPYLASSITVPVEALAVVREALWLHISLIVEEVLGQLIARRTPDLDDLWDRLDLARALLRDVDAADDDMQLQLGRRRGPAMIDVLRKQLDTERHMADTPDSGQHGRAEANAAAIERLLKAIG
jgi:hypothetical protein